MDVTYNNHNYYHHQLRHHHLPSTSPLPSPASSRIINITAMPNHNNISTALRECLISQKMRVMCTKIDILMDGLQDKLNANEIMCVVSKVEMSFRRLTGAAEWMWEKCPMSVLFSSKTDYHIKDSCIRINLIAIACGVCRGRRCYTTPFTEFILYNNKCIICRSSHYIFVFSNTLFYSIFFLFHTYSVAHIFWFSFIYVHHYLKILYIFNIKILPEGDK